MLIVIAIHIIFCV